MKPEPRYVLDTNVIISGLLFGKSKPAQCLRYALTNGKILMSVELLQELNDVLVRKRFEKYISKVKRESFLVALTKKSHWVEVNESVHECRDPKDNKILELAVNGRADFIVSGDKDLLVLNPFREIAIVSPESFLKLVE